MNWFRLTPSRWANLAAFLWRLLGNLRTIRPLSPVMSIGPGIGCLWSKAASIQLVAACSSADKVSLGVSPVAIHPGNYKSLPGRFRQFPAPQHGYTVS